MNQVALDLTECDREPIHIPGSIQPHGVLLVAERDSLLLRQAAGDVVGRFGVAEWEGMPLAAVLGEDIAAPARNTPDGPAGLYLGQVRGAGGKTFDVSAHADGASLLLDVEPAPEEEAHASVVLAGLEAATAAFNRADTISELCDVAASEFRRLTGFDRVMIYRFLDNGSGRVLAEARREGLHSFLNHHFPASDIPVQARALYVRNLVRVIPEVTYRPAPLLPALGGEPLDLSDSSLRSVSPIHLQYLRNMGVAASASVSIVMGEFLWGLIACHNETPRGIDLATRSACRVLAANLSRRLEAMAEAEDYRERLRLSSFADELVQVLSREGSLRDALSNHLPEIRRMLRGDGCAVLRGEDLLTDGVCPSPGELRALARWLAENSRSVLSTDCLGQLYPPGEKIQKQASGVLSMTLSSEESWQVIWFRSEHVAVVEWAGNPHKAVLADDQQTLTPRASFEVWREIVRGHARKWVAAEVDAAERLRAAILEARQTWRVKDLNRRLSDTLRDKDLLLEQKQFLIGEVNHRVQNSLQLVASFLKLQGRSSGDPAVRAALDEATRRLAAVSLMHKRLYRGDQVETVDASRYLEDLCADAGAAMGADWTANLTLELKPITMSTDRVISLGLILTELLINAHKYAYGGGVGPVIVRLNESAGDLTLTVADRGAGKSSERQGFGSRMIAALVAQLGGRLRYEDNKPGLRAELTAPAEGPAAKV